MRPTWLDYAKRYGWLLAAALLLLLVCPHCHYTHLF